MEKPSGLKKLCDEAQGLEKLKSIKWFQRPVRYWFGAKGLDGRIRDLNQQCFRFADNYLLKNDPAYLSIANENLKLMASVGVYFKVTSTTMAVLHSHSTRFKGNLSENGYAYCYTDQGNFPLNPVAEYMFPKRIQGSVDHWGNLNLKAVSAGFGFIQTLPVDYKGVIHSNGTIELNINETESDFLSGGRLMIDKMMANVFGSNDSAKRQFAENRNKMRQKVNELILSVSN